MQPQDKRWYLGLGATALIVCLLASAALGAYLLATLERGEIDAWMRSVGGELVARVEPLPETRAAPQLGFVAAGQSPFAPELLRSPRQSSR
ncbi:MAG: hypothetical protein H6Q35_2498 [Proteobacteria bacterium]|nr:hypothetical protein [Pseudomonadota bacterium]MBS1229275.1 hypothetical protein [Pseudomonadota bacterium]